MCGDSQRRQQIAPRLFLYREAETRVQDKRKSMRSFVGRLLGRLGSSCHEMMAFARWSGTAKITKLNVCRGNSTVRLMLVVNLGGVEVGGLGLDSSAEKDNCPYKNHACNGGMVTMSIHHCPLRQCHGGCLSVGTQHPVRRGKNRSTLPKVSSLGSRSLGSAALPGTSCRREMDLLPSLDRACLTAGTDELLSVRVALRGDHHQAATGVSGSIS